MVLPNTENQEEPGEINESEQELNQMGEATDEFVEINESQQELNEWEEIIDEEGFIDENQVEYFDENQMSENEDEWEDMGEESETIEHLNAQDPMLKFNQMLFHLQLKFLEMSSGRDLTRPVATGRDR